MSRPITPETAATRLAAACAQTEICPTDARKRLLRQGISGSEATKIISRLESEGFIDERRYARAFVRDKYRFAGWGRRKIAVGLAAKRIGRGVIEEALTEAVDAEEYEERLVALLRVRARSVKEEQQRTYEGRGKLYAYAVGRGYESELASRVIKERGEEIWPEIF